MKTWCVKQKERKGKEDGYRLHSVTSLASRCTSQVIERKDHFLAPGNKKMSSLPQLRIQVFLVMRQDFR